MAGGKTTIDSHVHLYSVDAIDGLRRIMDETSLDKVAVACLQYRTPHANPLALFMKARFPADTFVLGGLDYDPPGLDEHGLDFAGQARRLRELGADGMKMLEGKPNVRRFTGRPLYDPAYDQYYGYLQEHGIPVLFHVADPEEFWDEATAPAFAKENNWLYTDPGFLPKEQLYEESVEVLRRYPRMKVVFAHFYFLSADLDRAARFLDTWQNVSFDLTPGSEMYYNFSKRPQAWREFFATYRRRILFGTDNVGQTAELVTWGVENVKRVRDFLETASAFSGPGLALPPDVLDDIYAGNFERLCGREPRRADLSGLVAQCAILLEHARAAEAAFESIAQIERILRELPPLI